MLDEQHLRDLRVRLKGDPARRHYMFVGSTTWRSSPGSSQVYLCVPSALALGLIHGVWRPSQG